MKKFLVILMVLAMTSFLFVGCIPTNVGPVFTSTPGSTATVGTVYSYTPTATDADADTVTFSVAGPTGMAISAGVVTWTPTTAQIGSNSAVVTASDGTNATAQAFTITVSAAVTPDVVITTAAILGVTAPVTGATPVTTITAATQYTGTVTWSPTATTFAASTAYTATITLTAATGYTLTGVAANLFTVAGATSDTNPVNSGVVTAVFPATAAAGTIISIPGILGVTVPVYGAAPDLTVTASTQYTGVTTWKTAAGVAAGSTFEASTVYIATITLTAVTGFTATGVTANFFTVAGAAGVSNPANSGVVTATFATTAAGGEIVSIVAIAGVTAPVTGVAPDLTVNATVQYTGTVAWKTAAGVAVGTTFASGTVYVATITLIPVAGFTFTGVTANFFTVAGSAGVSNPVNSGVVTATYAATTTTPAVVSAVFTDSDTITITYNVAVNSTIADYNAANAINMVYPGASVLTPNQVDGTTTKYISITFTSASGVYATNTTTGNIDIAATVVSTVGGLALVAVTNQAIIAGGF